ncbi:DUF6207 family protein [Streptomyces swartbergensis]|uniref:DUF6207 family protein n=1 Tax=Streptomyces swartbergensis TaxID=487165 RepID=UPI003802D7F8
MEPMQDVNMAKPGLLVVEAAAADQETVLAFERAVAGRWATTDAHRTPKVPGQSGVWLRFFLDMRQRIAASASPARPQLGGRLGTSAPVWRSCP